MPKKMSDCILPDESQIIFGAGKVRGSSERKEEQETKAEPVSQDAEEVESDSCHTEDELISTGKNR
jgi:hypothetical protein